MRKNKKLNIEKFEKIKHIDVYGDEYWTASDLQSFLGYRRWENFNKAINKAMIACISSNFNIYNNFVYFEDMQDYNLTRFACYMIIQNCDPKKKMVALMQHYIITKTIEQETIVKFY